jgi:hypothetical protein
MSEVRGTTTVPGASPPSAPYRELGTSGRPDFRSTPATPFHALTGLWILVLNPPMVYVVA